MKDKEKIEAACKIEGCRVDDLFVGRVRGDGRVVLVIKPVGYKKIVDVEGVMSPEPVTFYGGEPEPTTLRPVEPAPSFVELVPEKILVVLKKHGLDDPATLREKSNKELEALPGIGRAAVGKLRELLKQVG